MAVVFISPKSRQRIFFIWITVVFLAFLIVVSLGIFLAKPKEIPPQMVFNKPKVNVNLKVFESLVFKELEPFTKMMLQFSYTAKTNKGKPVQGYISAESTAEAQQILEDRSLVEVSVKQIENGRSNPFAPYYQETILPLKKIKP